MQEISALLDRVPESRRPVTHNTARTIATLSAGLEPRLVDWALTVAAEAIRAAQDDLSPARRDVLSTTIPPSIEAISLNLMKFLRGRGPSAQVRISREQRDASVQSAQLGVPLQSVITGIRALERRWKEVLLDLVFARAAASRTLDLVKSLDVAVSTYFDALIDEDSRIWNEESKRLLEQQIIGERQLLERIIGGTPVDDELVEATLGLAPSLDHVGLVVSIAPETAPAVAFDFGAFRTAVDRRFPAHRTMAVPVAHDTVWLFLSGDAVPHDTIIERLQAAARDVPGAVVSVGIPSRGTKGLRVANLSAVAVHVLARRVPGAGPVLSFRDHGLIAIASQNAELARWFVDEEIGPLLREGASGDELRKTLATLIENSGSLAKTAEDLFVHRNTITYRLKRIEKILGRDPLARPMQTHAALALSRTLQPTDVSRA